MSPWLRCFTPPPANPRWKQRFLLGWTTGIVYWFVVCNWIQFVLENHGGMGFWGGWGTFLLFSLAKGLHLAVFTVVAGWLAGRWWSPVALAALWTGLERTHGTFGFAWLTLGNAGIDLGPLPRLAPLIGVYGISFLFALTAAALASRRWAWLAVVVVPFLLPRLPEVPATDSAVVMQPNLDESAQWTNDTQDRMERGLLIQSTAEVLKSKSRLVLWPESPGPIFYDDDPRFKTYVTDFVRTTQSWFLFGTDTFTPQGRPYNSALMIAPSGDVVDRYSKIYLVPFGEFIPPLFSFVNRITKEAGDFLPGNRIVIFPYRDHKLGTFICYESAFPHLVRQFAAADAYVNLSNDGYFGRSYAREQHLSLVRMRAVENARWIVRSTNDGITASVDPTGRVVQRLEPFKELAATLKFGYNASPTPYARLGDWFAWTCLLVALPAAAATLRRPANGV